VLSFGESVVGMRRFSGAEKRLAIHASNARLRRLNVEFAHRAIGDGTRTFVDELMAKRHYQSERVPNQCNRLWVLVAKSMERER